MRSQSNEDEKQRRPGTPGETKQNPGKNDGGGRLDPRQEPDNTVAQPASGAMSDFVETAFQLQGKRGQSDSSIKRARRRGRVWIA